MAFARPRARLARTPTLALVGLAAVSALAYGCSFRAQDLPLPGGPDVGGQAYTVTADFDDALDLVPHSAVKVDDVTVGEVESISLHDWTAQVRMRVEDSVRLPDNATARIRQTSLLGEKFVSLAGPVGGQHPVGRLGNGDVIPAGRTGTSVEVEQVLSSLAALLNGGGVAQLKTIETELNKALHGRESDVRQLLHRLDTVIGELDAHKRDITTAIDKLDRLTAQLKAQRRTLATAIDELPGALTVLADQRRNLTRLLTELSKLGTVGTRVIEGSRKDLVANLRALDPVVTELAAAGDSLPKSLQVLATYPFTDSTVNAVQGDYTNLQMTLDLDLPSLLSGKGPLPLPTLGPLPTGAPAPTDGPTGPPTPGPRTPVPSSSPPATGLPLPCLPLLCSGGAAPGAGAGSGSGGGTSQPAPGAYDPKVAQLLMGGLAR